MTTTTTTRRLALAALPLRAEVGLLAGADSKAKANETDEDRATSMRRSVDAVAPTMLSLQLLLVHTYKASHS